MIYKYFVKGDHPTFKRFDGYYRSWTEAKLIALELEEAGYEVEIEDLITKEIIEE